MKTKQVRPHQFTFFADSGHGWLRVKRMVAVNTGEKFSRFSYQKGQWVYLEEDVDAPKFLAFFDQHGIAYTIKERFANRSSIRNMEPFSYVSTC